MHHAALHELQNSFAAALIADVQHPVADTIEDGHEQNGVGDRSPDSALRCEVDENNGQNGKQNDLRQSVADTGARVTLRQGDLFAAAAGERFDIIVSNPPYITAEEMADLQPEVCREPALALYGGLDGLDFYRRIAREAPDYLLPGGWLLLEIGSAQAEAVSALLAERFEALAVYPDMQGLPRAVAARLRECARV